MELRIQKTELRIQRILFFLLVFLVSEFCFLNTASAAIWLGDCDNKPYDVIVRNSGSEKVVRLTRSSGEIQEYGAVEGISFQIKDAGRQPVVRAMSPDSEFCIWSGKIKIQRIRMVGSGGSGSF